MNAWAFAPAKINLTLQVGRPRADGLHPLQSVVAFAGVGDVVRAEPADALSLHVGGPFAAALTGANLVLRAAAALQAAAGVKAGAALHLDKRLPIASGIGGGSSDAAAALKCCNTMWDLKWRQEELDAVARTLGADVPVCLSAAGAYMTGAGEVHEPLDIPPCSAVLVNPLTPLATPDVYREFDRLNLGGQFAPAPRPSFDSASAVAQAVNVIGNDLQAPALNLAPSLHAVFQALSEDPRARCVSLSGSGATVFALTAAEAEADALAADLRARHASWWVVSTTLA